MRGLVALAHRIAVNLVMLIGGWGIIYELSRLFEWPEESPHLSFARGLFSLWGSFIAWAFWRHLEAEVS